MRVLHLVHVASAASAADRKHFRLTRADGGASHLFEGALDGARAAATAGFGFERNQQEGRRRLGGRPRAGQALDVSLQLLVASLDLVATLLSALQGALQSGHAAATLVQGRLELGHSGPQLLVLLPQTDTRCRGSEWESVGGQTARQQLDGVRNQTSAPQLMK